MWRDAELPSERPRQMTLIAESGGQRHFRETSAGTHQLLRKLEAALHDI
jgi:hypothetical protein